MKYKIQTRQNQIQQKRHKIQKKNKQKFENWVLILDTIKNNIYIFECATSPTPKKNKNPFI
jgi:hypothetical protein